MFIPESDLQELERNGYDRRRDPMLLIDGVVLLDVAGNGARLLCTT